MYTGETLFLTNDEGNVDEKQLRILYEWTEEFKKERLEKVRDVSARNLIARLLMKEPSKRPDANHALAHPFISGLKVARMIGEEAEFDVFLSYRVNSDYNHCALMYQMLTERGLKVWWDKLCLRPGVPWEEGFCEGLIKCRTFVALLSRGGMKNDKNDRQNFGFLTESSPCDNVLLEYRLALELSSMKLLEAVFPVMIGDSSSEGTDPKSCTYSNYFKSGCFPDCPEIVVNSVEVKLREHLDHQGLGAPVISNCTVKNILHLLTTNQGGFIQGPGGDSFRSVVDTIQVMVEQIKSSALGPNGFKFTSFNGNDLSVGNGVSAIIAAKESQINYLRRENEILLLGMSKLDALTSDGANNNIPSRRNSNPKVSKNLTKYMFSFFVHLITTILSLGGYGECIRFC